MISGYCNSVVFVVNSSKNQNFMQVFKNFCTCFVKYREVGKSIVLFTDLLNKIVLNFKVFKLLAFLTFFIFFFYLLNADFIYANSNLYTNCYTDFLTKELHFTNSMARINHCVQWENKFTS